MIIRNPNWLTEILWSRTSYAKEKMLSPFKYLPEAGCIADFV
jgi:hypothetical protein